MTETRTINIFLRIGFNNGNGNVIRDVYMPPIKRFKIVELFTSLGGIQACLLLNTTFNQVWGSILEDVVYNDTSLSNSGITYDCNKNEKFDFNSDITFQITDFNRARQNITGYCGVLLECYV